MRNLLFAGLLLLCSSISRAQYVQPVPLYKPDLNRMQQTLDRRNNSYNSNSNAVVGLYNYLMSIELVNNSNISVLKDHQWRVKDWWNKKGQYVDYSIAQNSEAAKDYILWIFKNKTIGDELSMLDQMDKQLGAIQDRYPITYTKNERFIEIMKAYSFLETCNPENIVSLATDYNLYWK